MQWEHLIKPGTANIILGKRGSGKSGLGYFLLERLSKRHNLLPCVVNFPRGKEYLLPSSFIVRDLDEIGKLDNSIILIDEGTTYLPAGQRKLEELVKAIQSSVRQQDQIILFVFHASSDVGSRLLRGMDTIIAKEVSQRQIQWGSKDNFFRDFLMEARREFRKISKAERVKFAYVDSDEQNFRGLMENGLASFWRERVGEELSKVWAGVGLPGMSVQQLKTKQSKQEEEALKIQGMEQEAVKGEGKCCLCGQEGQLLNDTCPLCFKEWARSVC